MTENKTPDPNPQSLKVEDILAKAEEIRNARDRQSSVTNSDVGEAFKFFTVADEESKLLTNKKDSFKVARLVWNWTGFGDKKLWDIIQILFVPVALAVAGFWFQDFTKKQEVKLADSKTKQELQVADSKAKQETLIKYLDQMSDLLEKGLLKSKQDSPIFIIAQSKTVTALQSLDTERQRLLIQFFKSANLNTLDGGKGLLFKARMSEAKLQNIDFSGINLNEVDLSGADLEGANLNGSKLKGANLTISNLSKANLSKADLSKAELTGAILIGAFLEEANLSKANISETFFSEANLKNVNFSNSIMKGTGFHDVEYLERKQLEKSSSPIICGSFLPENIKVDRFRDCNIMPQVLLKRYPQLKTLAEAQLYVESDTNSAQDSKYNITIDETD